MPSHVTVAAGIIWKEGKILVAKRPEGKPRAGYWEFPGGKKEGNESIEETLARELKEELGITSEKMQFWQTVEHGYPDLLVTLHFLYVLAFSGDPEPKEGQTLAWVTIEEAKTMNFLSGDIAMVQQLTPPEFS